MTVQAKDAYGNNLTLGGATVTITKSFGTGTIGSVSDNGDGTYSATVTSPSATGSGVFISTMGGVQVKSGTGSQTTSTVTYTAGALDHFAISTITSPQTAGTAITGITITAQDLTNNTVTSFAGTVTFGGTAGVTGTSAPFTSGQITGVSVTPTTEGTSQTITVTASGNTGTSNTFTINPNAPTGSASQIFCASVSPTVADLAATGSNIQWYAAASGGTPLATSTPLSNGTHYYASQTISSCESITRFDVTATVYPNFNSGAIETTGETICYSGNPAQIGSSTAASGGDGNITYSWRSSADSYTAAIGGATSATYLPPTGLIATTSYRRYAHDGTCNTTFEVSTGTWIVTVVDPAAPTGPASQTFCLAEDKTISDLTATLTSGTNIQWYSASTNGTQYLTTAVLTTGSYFASQTNGDGCESTTRKQVAVTINPNPDLTGLTTTASDVCQTEQSVVTLSATTLPNGTYMVNYTLTGDNSQSATDVSMSVTGGTSSGTFTTTSLSVAGTTTVTINSLTLNGCPTTATSGNTHTIISTATGTWLGTTSTAWNTASNWCGGVPTSSTEVVIPSGGNQPLIGAAAVCNSITINAGATVTMNGSNTLTVSGNFVNNGTFTPGTGTVIFDGTSVISGSTVNTFNNLTISGTLTGPLSATIHITGNWNNSGTFTHNDGTVAFTGTTTQTIGGSSTSPFYNLTADKTSADIVLTTDESVNGTLTLTAGIIDAITNGVTLTIGSAGSATAGSTTSYVKGQLSRIYAGTGSKNFPVGNGNYHPMTLTYSQLTGTSTVTVLETEDAITIPQNILATQITDAITSISRHWAVSQSGGSNFRYTVNLDGTGVTPTHPMIMILANHSSVELSDVTTPDYTNVKEFTSFSDLGLGEFAIKTSIVDDSWNTDGTWLPVGVPVATDNVLVNNAVTIGDTPDAVCHDLTINTAKSLTIGAGMALTVGGTLINSAGTSGLIISSDATGTASLLHNTTSIAATVNRYITGSAEDWHFLSSPVTQQTIGSGWLPSGTYGNGTGYDLYLWNEPTSCWIYKLNTTSTVNWNTVHLQSYFVPGRGYLYSVQATNPTKMFTGNLNNGAINYTLAYASDTTGLKGFNLVGNPYPSSIDWQATSGWSRSGLAVSGSGYDMWIWNQSANNYGVCNSYGGAGTNSVTRYIAPMQGFFVRAASGGSLGFSNAIRVHDGANNWKSARLNSEVISAVVLSERDGTFDEARLLFGYPDGLIGTSKLFSPVTTAPSLYLHAGNSNFTIRYLSDTVAYSQVPVQFKAGADGTYSLSASFEPGAFTTVLLEDLQKRVIQDLKAEPTYRFSASTTDGANRFVLHFAPVTGQATNELPARITTNGTQIFVDLTQLTGDTRVSVYDVLGRKLFEEQFAGEAQYALNYNPARELLLVELQNHQGKLVRKIVCNGTNH